MSSEQRLREALNAAVALLENLQHGHAKTGCPICENIDAWKKLLASDAALASTPVPSLTFEKWFDSYSTTYSKYQWSLRDAWEAAREI